MTDNQIIAETILRQLGGGRFKTMTGARDFSAIERGLSFRLPTRFAKDGINYVKIVLTGADLYDMEFVKIGPSPSLKGLIAGKTQKVTQVIGFEGAFNFQLQNLFTKATGLDTHL